MANRLVIGDIGNGNFGMKCSLPGNNALNTGNDDNPDFFSIHSEWDTLLQVGLIGNSTWNPTNEALSHSGNITHGLGYAPYVECRRKDGNRVYDDEADRDAAADMEGYYRARVNNNSTFRIETFNFKHLGSSTAFYIVYLEPATSL